MSDPNKSSISPDAAASNKRMQNAAGNLIPLAPKPAVAAPPPPLSQQALTIRTNTPQSSGSSGSRPRSHTPCPVCYRVGCKLPTHTAFTNLSRSSSTSSPDDTVVQTPRGDSTFTASYAYQVVHQSVGRGVAAPQVDPFYDLPLEPEMNTPEMHRLFHACTSIVCLTLSSLLTNPGFATETKDCFHIPKPREVDGDLICGSFFLPALQDPLLCLSILAASSASLSRRSHRQRQNITARTLLGQALQRMRERLNADPTHITDTTIVAAVFLWIVNVFLEDTDAMASHAASTYAFVETRGGLPNLGLVGAIAQLIRWVDAIYSLIAPITCHYLDIAEQSALSGQLATRYGSYWNQMPAGVRLSIDPVVVVACQDTCRLLEQLELLEIDTISGAEYLQMIESLCSLFTNGSISRAQHSSSGTVNECVVIAISLIQFHCFCGIEKLPFMARVNIGRLATAIKSTGGQSYWQDDLDLLIWLLFVVVMIPVQSDQKAWCLPFLCRVIATRFGEHDDLTGSWQQELEMCLCQFVWCHSRLEALFNDACTMISEELKLISAEHKGKAKAGGGDDDDDDDDDEDTDDEE